jgi:hypothetical protein
MKLKENNYKKTRCAPLPTSPRWGEEMNGYSAGVPECPVEISF